MNIYHLYENQFDELKERLSFTYCPADLEAIGADVTDWSADDWNNWSNDNITDIMVIKAFSVYDFTCDDFFTTAGMYTEYPETDDIINGNFRIATLPISRFITSDGENFTDENAAVIHQKIIDANTGAQIPDDYICGCIARLAKNPLSEV